MKKVIALFFALCLCLMCSCTKEETQTKTIAGIDVGEYVGIYPSNYFRWKTSKGIASVHESSFFTKQFSERDADFLQQLSTPEISDLEYDSYTGQKYTVRYNCDEWSTLILMFTDDFSCVIASENSQETDGNFYLVENPEAVKEYFMDYYVPEDTYQYIRKTSREIALLGSLSKIAEKYDLYVTKETPVPDSEAMKLSIVPFSDEDDEYIIGYCTELVHTPKTGGLGGEFTYRYLLEIRINEDTGDNPGVIYVLFDGEDDAHLKVSCIIYNGYAD